MTLQVGFSIDTIYERRRTMTPEHLRKMLLSEPTIFTNFRSIAVLLSFVRCCSRFAMYHDQRTFGGFIGSVRTWTDDARDEYASGLNDIVATLRGLPVENKKLIFHKPTTGMGAIDCKSLDAHMLVEKLFSTKEWRSPGVVLGL